MFNIPSLKLISMVTHLYGSHELMGGFFKKAWCNGSMTDLEENIESYFKYEIKYKTEYDS